MQYGFQIVDVFSSEPFGGNQLAVITDARGLADAEMRSIAREFNFSETAFVLPATSGTAAARIRIFTPSVELPFASHPVVDTAAVLVSIGHSTEGAFQLELGARTVSVNVAPRGDEMEATLVLTGDLEAESSALTTDELAELLSLDRGEIIDGFEASAGVPFCFVHLSDAQAVDRAKLKLESWKCMLQSIRAPQFYVFAGNLTNEGRLYSRMFAPGLGIEEDPATGGACIALVGAGALRSGTTDGSFELVITQGVAMGRPSLIKAGAEIRGAHVRLSRVGGNVSAFAEGILRVL